MSDVTAVMGATRTRSSRCSRIGEGIAEVLESLDAARHLIERVRDPNRRSTLEAAYLQTEVPMIEARRAGHRFVFDQLEERLATARERMAALLSELVNPSQ